MQSLLDQNHNDNDKNNNQKIENNKNEEEQIAAQMAAVAIAAETSSGSPALAAHYAKNISATIAKLEPRSHSHNLPDLMSNKMKRMQSFAMSNRFVVDREVVLVYIQNFTSLSNAVVEEANSNCSVPSTVIHQSSLSANSLEFSKESEDFTGTKRPVSMGNDLVISALQPQLSFQSRYSVSALQRQIAQGNNPHFFHCLLLLHNCYFTSSTKSKDGDCSPTTSSKNFHCADNDDGCNASLGDDTIKIPHDNVNDDDCQMAATLILDTLFQIQQSYNQLLGLLNFHDEIMSMDESKSMGVDACANASRDELNSQENDDFPGSFASHSYSVESSSSPCAFPDALPSSASSEGGDATNVFFRACAPIGNGDVLEKKRSPVDNPHGETGHGSERLESEGDPLDGSNSNTNNSGTLEKDEEEDKDIKSKGMPFQATSRNVASGIMNQFFSTVNKRRHRRKNEEESGTKSATSIDVGVGDIDHSLQSSESSKSEATSPRQNIKIGQDYNVVITREMLGLTVENVLERTVVRTVLPNGAAKKAGTQVGSLIVKVGTVETENLTHFETIDELRQSQRPLKLVLRKIGKEALRCAREEMGRLIKGGDFGISLTDFAKDTDDENESIFSSSTTSVEKSVIQRSRSDNFSKMLYNQWFSGTQRKLQNCSAVATKRDESMSKAGAKLVWILSLLVFGLEREAAKTKSKTDEDLSIASDLSDRSIKDLSDAARSVSKILHDYVQNHFKSANLRKADGYVTAQVTVKRKKQAASPRNIQDKQSKAVPGKSRRSLDNKRHSAMSQTLPADEALLQIGDVLQRARSFLADPNSRPAVLLTGEIISLLCDILDLDNNMVLSEAESSSSTAGESQASISDLGSAGSLLKLIVLNCSPRNSVLFENEVVGYHSGNRFLAVVHRLAASRSTSSRVTACSLGPVLWNHLDFPHQLQLRGVITRALHDADVIVRKATASVLHEIAELVFDPRAVSWLVLMCERAMTDPDPQLRSAAMTLTYHLAEHLPNAFLGDASEGSRSIHVMPSRSDPQFADVYLLQCKLLPVATRLAEDSNGSVRLSVAAQCDRLAGALGEHWHSVIVDLLQALLSDKDDRVRGEATLCLPRLTEAIVSQLSSNSSSSDKSPKISVLESLLPVALKLQNDPVTEVRICLAAASGELLSFLVWRHPSKDIDLSKEGTNEDSPPKRYIDNQLIPLLQRLLQDSDPEVTSAALRAVTNASRSHSRDMECRRNEDDSLSLSSHQSLVAEQVEPVFRPVLSEAQVMKLVPTLSALSSSTQWRVRQSAVEIVPALLGCTHRTETRSEIARLCFTLMNDSVDAVRNSAAECLCLGGSNLGSGESSEAGEWLSAVVLPHLETCRDSSNSKQRLLCLKMAEMILVNMARWNVTVDSDVGITSHGKCHDGKSSMSRRILEVASTLSMDKIVNVRLNVGRTCINSLSSLSKDDVEFVMEIMRNQLNSELSRNGGGDRDVIFFAKKSIEQAKERLQTLA